MIAIFTINMDLGQECAQFKDLVSIFEELVNVMLRMRYVLPILSFIHPSVHKYFVSMQWIDTIIFLSNVANQLLKSVYSKEKNLVKKYIQKDDIFDYFINELQPLDFADDKFMDYLSVHVYLLIYASNLTITKHLTSVLFDYGGRPELWKELYEEQLKIHNELNGNLSIDDVNKMIKLDCFIKESFRHSADIAGLPHIVIADSYTFSNGTTVPRDRDVFLYMQDTNFNNKFYGETSDDFQPKRHITSYSDGNITRNVVRSTNTRNVVRSTKCMINRQLSVYDSLNLIGWRIQIDNWMFGNMMYIITSYESVFVIRFDKLVAVRIFYILPRESVPVMPCYFW
ncbi:cytochrome P450 [Gigaspora rosea]|uniref:Cytochrome P450 n=1 Tax=Gigaspora rosea TaxID=44941 RepID=A0A397UZI1_9GLOM|nr:cytochrome P450 [Gigaspora rosea]